MLTNQLTEAGIERLALLAEECAEVIQVIGKILRHGLDSSSPVKHPLGQDTNRVILQRELQDVYLAVELMKQERDFEGSLDMLTLAQYTRDKRKRLNTYLHHNKIDEI